MERSELGPEQQTPPEEAHAEIHLPRVTQNSTPRVTVGLLPFLSPEPCSYSSSAEGPQLHFKVKLTEVKGVPKVIAQTVEEPGLKLEPGIEKSSLFHSLFFQTCFIIKFTQSSCLT